MEQRLTAEYEGRVRSMVAVVEADLARESRIIAGRLRALASELAGDDRFRLATLRKDVTARRYLLDYGTEAMALSGLSFLQVQDSTGKILTSGHFRNEFDRLQPEFPRLLSAAAGLALVRARTAEGRLLTLARIDSFVVGGHRFSLSGGIGPERVFSGAPSGDAELSVQLLYPGQQLAPAPIARTLREFPLPYLDLLSTSTMLDTARLRITQSSGTLDALRRSVNRWFLVALTLTAALSLILAAWLSSLVSKPLTELARKTSEIDLDRLDQSFDSHRSDEIGALSRLLGSMTQRLQVSTARLREVERRAAVGDLARQVNHDIKNGLAPIRNVLRHLAQVGRQEPQLLPAVFEERRSTLESSVEYLETLAQNYARLSPGHERRPCDINAVVDQVIRSTRCDGVRIEPRLSQPPPYVLGDTLLLRRILENLVVNALESMSGSQGGTVTVSTETRADGTADRVRLTVADTGRGMSREQLDRAFDDFYTTKPHGTGLGLSIVRRLVMDLDGSLRVETEPGSGTRVILDFPPATARQSPAV
jgi:signal transduction histidine kinase